MPQTAFDGRSLRVRTQSARFMVSATLTCRGLPQSRYARQLPPGGSLEKGGVAKNNRDT